MSILAITLIYNHYRKYNHDGLLILTIAIIFASFSPFAHLGHLIFHDKKYEELITNVSAVMISLLITGTYLSIIGFNRLIEKRSLRHISGLAPIYLIGLILNTVVIKHEYIDEKWQVIYQPEYAFYLFAACVVVIQVDLYVLIYSMIRYTKIPQVKHLFYLTSIIFFSLAPLLILRKFVLLPQNILLLPISTFYLLFTVLLSFYPLVFFSSTASPYLLTIFDAKNNQILRSYTFLEPKNEERAEQILGQVIEFYDILNDRIFSNDLKEIQMNSFTYYFENKDGLSYILVLNRSSESFKRLLYELSHEISNSFQTNSDVFSPNKSDLDHIENSIDKVFVHQLERLELVRHDIDQNSHDKIVNYIEKNQSLKLILHPVRLSIIQLLNENQSMLRTNLTKLLNINSGTLQRHLEVLNEAEYIGEDTKFIEDKPRKSIFITQNGISDYSLFKKYMRNLVKSYVNN